MSCCNDRSMSWMDAVKLRTSEICTQIRNVFHSVSIERFSIFKSNVFSKIIARQDNKK